MSTALWIITGVLAALYLSAGALKTFRPRAALKPSLPWVEDYSDSAVRMIGIVELLGALGLVLPWLLWINPALIPLAATGLAIVQILAIVVHLRRGEQTVLPFNLTLLLAAVFIAAMRFTAL